MDPLLSLPPFFTPDPRRLRALALRGIPVSYGPEVQAGVEAPQDLAPEAPPGPAVDPRSRADALYNQAMSLMNTPADPAPQLQQMGRNLKGARNQLALALAAQEAGEQYQPLSGFALKRAMELRSPLKVGDVGVVDESGTFVPDVARQNEKRAQVLLQQAAKYEQIAERSANEAQRIEALKAAQEARKQASSLNEELARQRLALQEQSLAIRQDEADRRKREAEQKVREEVSRKTAAIRDAEEYTYSTLSAIERAEKILGTASVGTVGYLMRRLPGTTAADLENVIDTIKANISFQALSDMRRASATGGALGNVSNREIELLGATRAPLGQNQSIASFRESLRFIKEYFMKVKDYIEEDKAAVNELMANTGLAGRRSASAPQGAVRPRAQSSAPAAVPADVPPPGAVRLR